MPSTCCRNRLEACCSAESPAPPPPAAAAAAAAAAAKLLAPLGGAGVAPRLRFSSAARFSLSAAPLAGRGVAPTAALGGSCVGGSPPATAATSPARGVASGSAAGVAAGVPKRLRMLSSSPALLDSADCCSAERSATLRSYFSHCRCWVGGGGQGRGGSEAGRSRERRQRAEGGGHRRQGVWTRRWPRWLPRRLACADSCSKRAAAEPGGSIRREAKRSRAQKAKAAQAAREGMVSTGAGSGERGERRATGRGRRPLTARLGCPCGPWKRSEAGANVWVVADLPSSSTAAPPPPSWLHADIGSALFPTSLSWCVFPPHKST